MCHSQFVALCFFISLLSLFPISFISLRNLNTFINMPTNQVKNKLQLSVKIFYSFLLSSDLSDDNQNALSRPPRCSSSLPTLQLKLKLQPTRIQLRCSDRNQSDNRGSQIQAQTDRERERKTEISFN